MRTIFNLTMDHDTSLDMGREKYICSQANFCNKVLGQRVFFKLPMWSFDPQIKFILDGRKEYFFNTIDAIIDRNYETYGKDLEKWPDNAMRALLMDKEVSRSELHQQLTTILMAGFETTAAYLSYAAFRIAKYTKVQERIRHEIKEVLGDRTNIVSKDLAKFTFLSSVLKESMRWLVIVPALTRFTTQDTEVKMENNATVKIPKGTNVFIPFYLPNFDETLWDEPNKFIPDRMEKIPDPGASVRHGYMPFGYGTRTCIGNYLAQAEAEIALIHLLRNFRFELVPGFKPIPEFGVSTTSRNGMKIKLIPIQEK